MPFYGRTSLRTIYGRRGLPGADGADGADGRDGVDGLPGVNAVPADEAVGTYASTLGTNTRDALEDGFPARVRPVKHAPAFGLYFPEAEGAVGDGVADDTAEVQAAIDAALADGGGEVLLNGRYAWTGDLIQRGGVSVSGPATAKWLGASAPLSTNEPGLIALSSTSRYVYGTSGNDSRDDNPGPMTNVLIDGRNVGGSNGSLVLCQGAQGRWTQVTVINSVGHGVRLNGMAQNSNFDSCYFSHNDLSNLRFYGEAGFQGAGGNKFNNCYFGDCSVSNLIFDAPDAGCWSHDTIFNNCLFEQRDASIKNIIEAKIGDAQFNSCVITRSSGVGTTVTDDALVVISNPIWTVAGTTLSFSNCYFNGGGAITPDAIRCITNGVTNEVRIGGPRTRITNVDYVLCCDTGTTVASFTGPISRSSGVAWYRAINGGNISGVRQETGMPWRWAMPTDASGLLPTPIDIRHEGDTQPRWTIDRDGTLRWRDGATSTVRGSLAYNGTSVLMEAGGYWRMQNAFGLRYAAVDVNAPNTAVSLSDATTALPGYALVFSNGASADVTISTGTTGSQVQILIGAGSVTTSAWINWPAEVKWHAEPPQPIPGKSFVVNLVNYFGFWYDYAAGTPTPAQEDANRITTGMETYSREHADQLNITLPTQTLALTYFSAYKTQIVANIKTYTGNTAAGATPTLARLGLYSVASNGDLTLIASTASDTSLWAAATTGYTKALSSSVTLRPGQRYALGALVVTSAAAPTLVAHQPSSLIAAEAPRLCGQVGSQTDLPSSVTAASVVSTNRRIFAALL